MNNRFITLEGGEGAGKSTLLDKLASWLSQEGYDVVKTREPGGTELAEQLRRWLLDPAYGTINLRSELLLLLAGRADHIDRVIAPALAAGKVVLCDRFNDSTIAYQGGGRGLDSALLEKFCQFSCKDTLPSLTLLLDIDPAVGLRRTKQRASTGDKIEKELLPFHEAIRQTFLELAACNPRRIALLDATLPPDALLAAAQLVVERHLNQH